ncbi:MAG TPA: AmmeMemoRadiSam system protein B [Anaerolineales bacterium]|nr:AmmeMemoRadiSam system protein B [Anaerolineales bacterium]
MMSSLDLRPSPIAGTWYPKDPEILANSIDAYLKEVQLLTLEGQVLGVIAPHAGHRYSGAVAAHAFATLRGLTPDLVVVISPFHNFDPHPLLTTKHQAYATPLGNIEVDQHTLNELRSHLQIPITPIAKDKEHSLEIELPFLQRVLKNDFKLLPIMVRAQEETVAKQLGEALAKTIQNRNAILVASTDLSHFYDQQTAQKLDQEMLNRFTTLNPTTIFEAEQTGKGFACGHAAVATVQWAAKELGANNVQILKYATSGDVTGDFQSVVGYGAAAILRT